MVLGIEPLATGVKCIDPHPHPSKGGVEEQQQRRKKCGRSWGVGIMVDIRRHKQVVWERLLR
jgi:hypothetical protein